MKWFCLYCMSFPWQVTWEQFTKWFCSIQYLAKLDFQWNWETHCVSHTKEINQLQSLSISCLLYSCQCVSSCLHLQSQSFHTRFAKKKLKIHWKFEHSSWSSRDINFLSYNLMGFNKINQSITEFVYLSMPFFKLTIFIDSNKF